MITHVGAVLDMADIACLLRLYPSAAKEINRVVRRESIRKGRHTVHIDLHPREKKKPEL